MGGPEGMIDRARGTDGLQGRERGRNGEETDGGAVAYPPTLPPAGAVEDAPWESRRGGANEGANFGGREIFWGDEGGGGAGSKRGQEPPKGAERGQN